MKQTYYTTVINGKLNASWYKAVNSHEGDRVEVSISKAKKKRTNPQNAYLHGVVFLIVSNALNDLGHITNAADTKDKLKRMFLTVDDHVSEGVYLERTLNTSELDTEQMGKFLEDIKQFAAEYLNVYVPDPGEEMKLEL